MTHPLETIMREADGFVLIGDSSESRFPAQSFHCYTSVGKRFYCLDLGGLTESRGATKGERVFTSVEELPDDHDDLAVIWTRPETARRAIDVAVEAGCRRLWFSFKTATPESVGYARDQGLEVVEIGRCPVYYLDKQTPACKAHRLTTHRVTTPTVPRCRRGEFL